jgi:hypothetical protein
MEQQRELVKTVRAPDGWDDIYIDANKSFGVGGWLSGVTMQRGEPILEQDGHTLLVRQGETSFELRQRVIYLKMSRMTLAQEETGVEIPAVEVLVVHGFKGNRAGYTWFREGEERTVLDPGPEPVREFVVDWFDRARRNKIVRRRITRQVEIEQAELLDPSEVVALMTGD